MSTTDFPPIDPVEWANFVIDHFTTYSRRRYGHVTYTWANVQVYDVSGDVVTADNVVYFDPYPAVRFKRDALVHALSYAKRHRANLAICTPWDETCIRGKRGKSAA